MWKTALIKDLGFFSKFITSYTIRFCFSIKAFTLESATHYILDLLFFIMQQLATSEKDLF